MIAARGESPASHRGRRCARMARRDEREYREYLNEEQRSQPGCNAGRMQLEFHHGLLTLRHLPLPLPQAPATSLDCQCPGIARSRSDGVERPSPGWNDIVRVNTKIGRGMRRIVCRRDGKTVQRDRETLAARFEVSLLLCPTTEKGFGVEMARDGRQIVDFGC